MKIPFFTIFFLLNFHLILMANPLNPGKMIITGFKGTAANDPEVIRLKKKIQAKQIGGIILFKRNIKNRSQLKSLVDFLKQDTPIFVAIDHEGGLVNRLTHSSFNLEAPSAEKFCKYSTQNQVRMANKTAQKLKAIGVNLNFGGVVDIAPIIYPSSICKQGRCFSDSQEQITACASRILQAHANEHLIYALKHFPGHGSTPIDSHDSLPDISKTHTHYEHMPYHQLIHQNTNHVMVMMGHLMDRKIDAHFPASLSKNHISTLKQALNFNGLIITDDLNMRALNQTSVSKANLATLAASAGNHLLLFEYLTFDEMNEVLSALQVKINQDSTLKHHVQQTLIQIESMLASNS